MKTRILDHSSVLEKLERMAWQIWEMNASKKELVMAGIDARGYYVAKQLKSYLERISPLHIELIRLKIDKDSPNQGGITLEPKISMTSRDVVVVDDVLNSGITLMHACSYIMNENPETLRTVILANRDHTKFPVKADVVGISLATTLQEHISFDNVNEEDLKVYLS
jgi:pyrimidine operon attenuation protein/uracil phosphoribosyltransferase